MLYTGTIHAVIIYTGILYAGFICTGIIYAFIIYTGIIYVGMRKLLTAAVTNCWADLSIGCEYHRSTAWFCSNFAWHDNCMVGALIAANGIAAVQLLSH